MGSVAEKVLHASNVPVWLVRAGIAGITYDRWPRRTVIVPLDGSELAEAVLPHVKALAGQRSIEPIEVVLLGVCERAVTLGGYYSPSARFETSEGVVHVMPKEYIRREVAKQKRLTEQYLAGVEKRLKKAGFSVRTVVLMGEPAEQIVDYANMNPFNYIVMSTHARSGMSRWAYGSVAAKVLQKASSPIVLVRPR
jgi:nucleotide-binding universal stress UspA family protein